MSPLLQAAFSREARLVRRCGALHGGGGIEQVMRLLSRLGDGWLWAAVGFGLPAFGGARGRESAWAMAATLAVSLCLHLLLKRLIRRPRPHLRWRGITPLVPSPDRFSFPSGHTMNAFAAATVIAGAFPLLGIGLLTAAFLIGVSRVVLWLHYPSDVVVGGLLGVALGLLVPPFWASLFPLRLV